MTAVTGSDRGGGERRVRTVSLRYPEKRTGFDRRATSRYQSALTAYRREPGAIAAVLGLILALNAADLILTVRALGRGTGEANPLMAWLFDQHTVLAAIFKLAVGLAVTAVIWRLRRYRRVLELSIVLTALFGLVLSYHLVGTLLLA